MSATTKGLGILVLCVSSILTLFVVFHEYLIESMTLLMFGILCFFSFISICGFAYAFVNSVRIDSLLISETIKEEYHWYNDPEIQKKFK